MLLSKGATLDKSILDRIGVSDVESDARIQFNIVGSVKSSCSPNMGCMSYGHCDYLVYSDP